jgi:hypothetical protein
MIESLRLGIEAQTFVSTLMIGGLVAASGYAIYRRIRRNRIKSARGINVELGNGGSYFNL